MRLQRLFLHVFVAMMTFCGTAAFAQRYAPTIRLVDRIDESNLVTLKGNTHPAAKAANDLGRVSDSLAMTDLILVLKRDAAQQAAFEKFVASQYDSNSPNYHQWLTAGQVGENFGPSQTDILTLSNWLTGHGFSVDEVSKDRMSIRFSGTAGKVLSTFHTEIHNLAGKDRAHIGNMSDPQIPAALAPAVVGVKSLHNFFPRPLYHLGSKVTHDSTTGKWLRPGNESSSTASLAAPGSAFGLSTKREAIRPQFTISVGGSSPYLVEDVGPWDFATIYNIKPLWNASTPIDGTGQTIAIAGTSAVCVGQSGPCNGANDVATFRTYFGLPTSNAANTPILISGNSQPITVCTDTTGKVPFPGNPCEQGDLIENSLDVEWSGSVAKNAQIIMVSSYPSSTSDDALFDSESYIVNNVDTLNAHVMNVSYGECELGNGTAGNVKYYDLWQTAAAEGIAVFVASGDSGSASCDQGGDANGTPYPAEYGLSVSGLASTPYNTAVGGTDFNWCSLTAAECTAAPYWSATNDATTRVSALGYVPEVPWNDMCASPLALGFLQLLATNIGVSGVKDAETACAFASTYAYRYSVYQAYVFDMGQLVDTVGGGGGASGCVVGDGANVSSCLTSITSTGSANGSLPLVNDGWPKPSWQSGVTGIPSDGVRDIPDVSFFASDGYLSASAYLICVSNVATCSYSTRSEPVAQEVGGTSVATPAMAGVMALINQKTGAAQGNPNAELYKLAAAQTYANCSAEHVTTSSNCYFNDIDTGNNAMACDYGEGGYISPNCHPAESLGGVADQVGILSTGNSTVGGYNGATGYDLATGLGSLNVANVVNAWPATVGTTAATVTVHPAQSSINTNNSLSVTVTLASTAAGGVTPTGTVTLTASGSSYSASATSYTGSYSFDIPANSLPGAAGGQLDTLTASYAGDAVYSAASNTAQVTVTTVVLLTPTVTVTPASATLNSNASLNVTVTVGGASITPTGTVKLSGGGYTSPTPNPTLVNGSYTFAIPANTLTAGTDTLTATYSGDANYNSGANTAPVTVTESTFSLPASSALTPSPSTIHAGASSMLTMPVNAVAGYTGTISFTCQLSGGPSTGDGATCVTSNSPVQLTSTVTSGSVVFTVNTRAAVASLAYPEMPGKGKGWLGAGGGAVLAFLVFLGVPARRRSWRQMLGAMALMAALGGAVGCGSGGSSGGGGGGGSSDPGTTAGVYTFTIQATGNPAVTPAVSTTFSVTVN